MHHPTRSDLTVLIVDDEAELIELIRPTIEQLSTVFKVIPAHSARQAKNQPAQFLIDVILCDIAMPGEDGISLISFAHGLSPRVPSIAFTALGGGPILAQALHAGAQGFLLKTAQAWEHEAAINAVANGATYISAQLLGDVQKFLRPPSEESFLLADLTENERKVTNLVKEGMTNQQIARACGLSLSTVKKYVSSLLSKFDCPSRTSLTVKLVEAEFWSHSANDQVFAQSSRLYVYPSPQR